MPAVTGRALPAGARGSVGARPARDATSVLRFFAATALLLPAGLVIAGVGLLTPALALGVVCGWLWVMGRLVPGLGPPAGSNPVRWGLYAFGAAVLASYVVATTSVLEPIQARAADRGMVMVAAALGVALLATDGVSSRRRLRDLISAVVVLGAAIAAVGILQFVAHVDLTESIRVPGLTIVDHGYDSIMARSLFNRVAGTTFHPIEFGVVLAMVLPFGLHLALTKGGARWWAALALIATAIPMSVSRSGALAVVTVVVVLVPALERSRRRRVLVIGAVFLVTMRLAIPGLLGTIRALFLSYGEDPSVQDRQSDYDYAWNFVGHRPFFGRGFSTFVPTSFDFLDNQYLLGLIEIGVVGTAALVGAFVIGIGCARSVRRWSSDPETRQLSQCFAATLCVPLVTFATFDFLSFPTARALAFLLLGCAGALWRLERGAEGAVGGDATQPVEAPEVGRP